MKGLSLAMLLTLLPWFASPAWSAAQPGKTYRIGYLSLAPIADTPSPERAAFFRALRELGYVEGKNLIVEYRSAEANVELLHDAATDLVELKPPLIFAEGTPTEVVCREAGDANDPDRHDRGGSGGERFGPEPRQAGWQLDRPLIARR